MMAEDMEKLIDALPKREIKPISLGHKCSFCPKTFTAMCTRKYHERSKHPEKFKDNILQFFCDECGNEFKRLWNLNNHKNSVHNTEKTFKCDAVGCGKMFKTNIARNEHTKIHTTTYKCTFKGCEKIFRSQQSYAQHLGVHKGYQFPCTFPGCNHPPFTRKRALHAHKTNKHKYTVAEYPCEECDKTYRRKYQLNAHMKYHSDKKYICDICGSSFYERSRLKFHLFKHSEVKPYKCHLCDKGTSKSYYSHQGLKKHMKKFHYNAPITTELNQNKLTVLTRSVVRGKRK